MTDPQVCIILTHMRSGRVRHHSQVYPVSVLPDDASKVKAWAVERANFSLSPHNSIKRVVKYEVYSVANLERE